MTPGPGIEPRPHWWEASALTTAPPLLANTHQGENQQQTQPTYDAGSGNRTQATLVGGERSHYCATRSLIASSKPAGFSLSLKLTSSKIHVRLQTKRLRLRLQLTATSTPQNNWVKEQTNGLHVRYSFWCISLPYSTKQQHEMTKFKFYGVRGHTMVKF